MSESETFKNFTRWLNIVGTEEQKKLANYINQQEQLSNADKNALFIKLNKKK